jgi:raffinose/stachyose/melibiose transport system permease protein
MRAGKRKQNIELLIFVFPALSLYAAFKIYPAAAGLFYSMTDWNGVNRAYAFTGLANFIELLSDAHFWRSILFTGKYVAVMLFLTNIAALGLAARIESLPKAKGLYRVIYYMPNMISMIIGGYMWRFIFHKALYYMADNWGFKFLDQSWAGDIRFAFLSIIVVAAWGSTGYLLIIYLAALQGVPGQLKEAAQLDGANGWKTFWRVTFPVIRPSLIICVFWTLNSTFQVFDVIFSLTGGGPGRATQSVAINIYEEAFKGNIRYGYATAKSTVLFFLILMVTAIQLAVMKKREEEA